MGLLDDAASAISGRPSHHTSHSRHHKHRHHSHSHRSRSSSPSPTRSGFTSAIFGDDRHHHKHNSSRASFFSLPNASKSSNFFGFSRPSYYRRSPRPNFVNRAIRRLKRLLRDLIYYAKRHPVRVFMLVVMPLVTGGALTALLALFGLRLPRSIEHMLGLAARAGSGDSIGLVGEAVRMVGGHGGHGSHGDVRTTTRLERGYGGGEDGLYWERRRSVSGDYDRYGHHGGGGGGWGSGWKEVAKFFS